MLDVELSNVTLNYGFKNILDGATFQVNSGDKVAIVGDNGTGKTSIFKLIVAEEKPSSGIVSKRKDATIGLLTQIAPKAEDGLSVRDFLKTAYSDIADLQRKLRQLESVMGDPNVTPEELEKAMNAYGKAQDLFIDKGGYEVDSNIEKMAGNLKISEMLDQEYNSLSGGQKTIVCLARMLLQKPDILLLDDNFPNITTSK